MNFVGKSIFKLFNLVFAVIIIGFFTACTGGGLGYGVVLLSPDSNALETGVLVKVKEKSDINNTYKVQRPDSNESFEIDTWRVEVFEKRSQAEARAKEYNSYVDLYARNLRDGLAIREEPSIDSNRVYKMRKNQEIKVLDATDVREEIGGHEGVWYHVLTKDGAQGYTFDYYLNIFDITAEPEVQQGPDLSPIQSMLERTYRPDSFEAMQEKQQIKLERFTTDYGLFSNLKDKNITIRLFKSTYTFEYDEIRRLSEDRYAFVPAELELIIRSEDTLQAVFTREDKTYDPTFVYYEEEKIKEIRENEQERREKLYETLRENGPLFTSSAYGEIEFIEDRRFSWRNLERLVPSIIPDSSYREGALSLDFFLTPELRSKYAGVIAFHFEQAPNTPVLFLYSLDGNALKLEYVPERNSDEKVIQQRSSSRLIMAFFGQNSN